VNEGKSIGVAVNDYTGLTIGTGWDTLQMGTSTSNTGQYWLDNLAFDAGLTPAIAAGLTVQDSAHISGSATFGSAVLVQPASNSAVAFQVQNTTAQSLLSVDTASSTVNVGATGSLSAASTVNVGTSTGAAQAVNVGSTKTTSATNLQAGTGGLSLFTGDAASGSSGSIYIKTGDAASGTSGNISIDNGSGSYNGGSSALNDTFEAAPCSSATSDFANWFSTTVTYTMEWRRRPHCFALFGNRHYHRLDPIDRHCRGP
jgi:hypothetical protein